MASYTMVKNTTLFVDFPTDYIENGWEVVGNVGYHSGCNAGYLDRVFDLSSAIQWVFKYKILTRTSGSINIVVNGISGIPRIAPGEYEETFNTNNPNSLVRFYSNGENSVSFLKVYPKDELGNGVTLAFNEEANAFITHLSYQPDFMLKFINKFFTFKNGQLWQHNINPVRNNFYGQQYTSVVKFYVNGDDPQMNKTFIGLIVNSNAVWASPNNDNIRIFPTKGKSKGMLSRLKPGRFKYDEGKWFADFLRNTIDPRFTDGLVALFKGAHLQGAIMELTLESSSTEEVRLISVDITFTKQNNIT